MFAVRPNRPEEGQRIVAIWRAAVAATHDFLSAEDRSAIEPEAQPYLLSTPLWVAVGPRDQPVAFMDLGPLSLEALFVDPPYRGKGIGRTLVSFAATLHPVLDTEVKAQNEQALGFYRHLGFVETGYSPSDGQGRHLSLDPHAACRRRDEISRRRASFGVCLSGDNEHGCKGPGRRKGGPPSDESLMPRWRGH